jgi:hypothetical protein
MAQSIMQKYENGQIVKKCYLTGRTDNLDKHHVYNNAFRNKSEKWGLWVYLNHDVHMKLHQTPQGQKVARWLKQQGQEAFERKYGHDKFIEEFKRNYL